MLYVLFGSDHYRRAGFIREIIDTRRAQYPDIVVRSFDCTQAGGVLDAYVFVSGTNLFEGGKKICICAQGAVALDDPLLVRLMAAAQRDDHIVFFVEDFDKKIPDAYRGVLKEIVYKEKEFPPLSPALARAYAASYAQTQGYQITSGACAFLASVFAADTWGMCNELDVLGALGWPIDEAFARGYHEGGLPGVFEYAQGILRATTRAERLRQWELALLSRAEPMFLFNVLAKAASDKKQVVLLSEYDRQIKSGRMNPDQALVSFCCSA